MRAIQMRTVRYESRTWRLTDDGAIVGHVMLSGLPIDGDQAQILGKVVAVLRRLR